MNPALVRAVALVRGGLPIKIAAERVGKSYHAVYMATVESGAHVPHSRDLPRGE